MKVQGFIILSLSLLFSLPGVAANLPEHKITIQQKKIGLRDALTSLLEETNMKYKISNNVTNEKKISIEAKDSRWSDVFQQLVSQGNLNFRVTSKNRVLVSP